jgi:hypothetical protein
MTMKRALFIAMLFGLQTFNISAQDRPAGQVRPRAADGTSASTYSAVPLTAARIEPRGIKELIDRWKVANDKRGRDTAEKLLRETLASEFSARLAAQEKEIDDFEEKVRQLRKRLAFRREWQRVIVEHRLQQLLHEARGLGWENDELDGQVLLMPWD